MHGGAPAIPAMFTSELRGDQIRFSSGEMQAAARCLENSHLPPGEHNPIGLIQAARKLGIEVLSYADYYARCASRKTDGR